MLVSALATRLWRALVRCGLRSRGDDIDGVVVVAAAAPAKDRGCPPPEVFVKRYGRVVQHDVRARGAVCLTSDLAVLGSVRADDAGDSCITGDVLIAGDCTISGGTCVTGSVTVLGNAASSGGDVCITGDLFVGGDLQVRGKLDVGGKLCVFGSKDVQPQHAH